ncbi:MAG TPA: DUF3757 domain-containing protein [Stenotrophomonas sp.]|nr:DUF3757 domain-containing protein [Stenotrophomonas sp.]
MRRLQFVAALAVAAVMVACQLVAPAQAQRMHCPAPERISYVQGRYVAEEKTAGWEGQWTSLAAPARAITRFDTALLAPDTNVAGRGILVNCTYLLKDGMQLDMSYQPRSRPGVESNFVVSIAGVPDWRPEAGAVGAAFLECTRSRERCGFQPLRVDPS